MAKVCASCGAPLDDNELFCTSCGTPVAQKKEESKKYCPQCGNVLAPDAIFCDVCGRETSRAKPKKKEAAPEEPAVMEGLLSPTITEDMFAASKARMNEKFDGFEAADESAIKKAEESQALMPKAMPTFEMDSAALPERKREEKPKPAPAPQKKEVTAETIKNSNPYGDYAAKSGGRTMQTAKDSSAQQPAKAKTPAESPAPAQAAPAEKKSGGFSGFINKIKSIFSKK